MSPAFWAICTVALRVKTQQFTIHLRMQFRSRTVVGFKLLCLADEDINVPSGRGRTQLPDRLYSGLQNPRVLTSMNTKIAPFSKTFFFQCEWFETPNSLDSTKESSFLTVCSLLLINSCSAQVSKCLKSTCVIITHHTFLSTASVPHACSRPDMIIGDLKSCDYQKRSTWASAATCWYFLIELWASKHSVAYTPPSPDCLTFCTFIWQRWKKSSGLLHSQSYFMNLTLILDIYVKIILNSYLILPDPWH